MGDISRRLAIAEARAQQVMIRQVAREYGLTYAELMEEAETFFRLPLAEQLAEVDRIAAELQAHGMSMDDVAEIKATLTTHDRPMA
jgi:hypothetical protein